MIFRFMAMFICNIKSVLDLLLHWTIYVSELMPPPPSALTDMFCITSVSRVKDNRDHPLNARLPTRKDGIRYSKRSSD